MMNDKNIDSQSEPDDRTALYTSITLKASLTENKSEAA